MKEDNFPAPREVSTSVQGTEEGFVLLLLFTVYSTNLLIIAIIYQAYSLCQAMRKAFEIIKSLNTHGRQVLLHFDLAEEKSKALRGDSW